jgi:hypothetical protein
MPIKSKAQQRLMYAAAAGDVKDGPSKTVANEMIKATPKKAFAKMPEKAAGKTARKAVMKRK